MKCSCNSCCSTTGATSRTDARIQGWLVLGPGDISLCRTEASILLAWRTRAGICGPGCFRFLFIYTSSLSPVLAGNILSFSRTTKVSCLPSFKTKDAMRGLCVCVCVCLSAVGGVHAAFFFQTSVGSFRGAHCSSR